VFTAVVAHLLLASCGPSNSPDARSVTKGQTSGLVGKPGSTNDFDPAPDEAAGAPETNPAAASRAGDTAIAKQTESHARRNVTEVSSSDHSVASDSRQRETINGDALILQGEQRVHTEDEVGRPYFVFDDKIHDFAPGGYMPDVRRRSLTDRNSPPESWTIWPEGTPPRIPPITPPR
jgi:hypothetical protein